MTNDLGLWPTSMNFEGKNSLLRLRNRNNGPGTPESWDLGIVPPS